MTNGLPRQSKQKLETVLQQSRHLKSANALRALFSDNRINAWSSEIHFEGSDDERIASVINQLRVKFDPKQNNRNVLVIFLEVLVDNEISHIKGDALSLIPELEAILTIDEVVPDEPPPVNSKNIQTKIWGRVLIGIFIFVILSILIIFNKGPISNWVNTQLTPTPSYFSYQAMVRDSNRHPIPSAEVIILFGGSQAPSSSITDDNGIVIIPINLTYDKKIVLITIQANCFETVNRNITLDKEASIDRFVMIEASC